MKEDFTVAPAARSSQMLANGTETAKRVRELSAPISRALFLETEALYAPLAEVAGADEVCVYQDIPYGQHERHRLDLYRPVAATAPCPILVFAHGGGFVAGDKATARNIGHYFARRGVLTAAINYRFAPESRWPGGIEDVAAVVQWLRTNAAAYGGQTGAIFLSGVSAGASHVGGYAVDRARSAGAEGVAGVILISLPNASLTGRELDPQRDALYYGETTEERAAQSIVNNLDDFELPLLLALAEYDIGIVHDSAAQLVAALYGRNGRVPNILTALGHNHVSVAAHIGTRDETLGPAMLEFILQTVANAAECAQD